MTHAVRAPARRSAPPVAREAPAGPGTELSPVLEALARSARSRSEALLSEAREAASTELSEARAESARILRQARAEGEESASRSAAILSARTRRQAHEEVLAARRVVLETLRRRAAAAVQEKVATAGGGVLVGALQALVNVRVGLAPPEGPGPRPGSVGAITARTANRRASTSVEDIVELVLNGLASEVESLWA